MTCFLVMVFIVKHVHAGTCIDKETNSLKSDFRIQWTSKHVIIAKFYFRKFNLKALLVLPLPQDILFILHIDKRVFILTILSNNFK